MSDWDLLLTDAILVSEDGGRLTDAALAVRDGTIAWLGPAAALPGDSASAYRSLDGRWLTPALIDCHTHVVFGGDRAHEYEQRLAGASYEDIARAGGGIRSTVSATRAADLASLVDSARGRMLALRASGVATLEVKSGYGLDVDTELRMLQAARTAARELGLSVRTTFLGAHAMPPDFAGGKDDYIDFIVDESLPAAHAAGLVDAVDAYCESIAFSGAQVARVFDKALALGLPVKLHADQLSDAGGAALAAAYRALSADHLEYADEAGVRAMAEAGCVAVLLPGAFITLGESRMPPVPLLREAGVPIAIASDCNPGTSPLSSLTFAMQLASRVFRLTPDECFDGVTRHAARALGLSDRGTLKVGKRADLAVWDFAHPRELSYWMGRSWLDSLYVAGTCRISA